MIKLTLDNITEQVVAAYGATPDPRLKELLGELIRHIHDFARKVDLTPDEWVYGLDFLKRAGQISDDKRHEFMLLSDMLGLSSLMDLKGGAHDPDATPSSVLGPFYVDDAPVIAPGADLKGDAPGEPVHMSGRITDQNGKPIAGAVMDFWQTRADGLYDVQLPDLGHYEFRGRMTVGEDGGYAIRTVKSLGYCIPTDGPGGEMMLAAGRSIWRPAHYHFFIRADGYRPLITELFPSDTEYLDTDAAFGVRESLVFDYQRSESAEDAAALGMASPFYKVNYDFRLSAF